MISRPGVVTYLQRANLLTFPEDFSNAAWVKTRVTVTADVVVAPDGNTTADDVVSTAVAGTHKLHEVFTFTAGACYTFSCFVKANNGFTGAQLQIDETGGNNANTGTLTFSSGALSTGAKNGSGTLLGQGRFIFPNSWYRLFMSYKAASSIAGVVALYGLGGTNVITDKYTAWGAMLENFSSVSRYPPL